MEPLKRQVKKADQEYTVMLIPHCGQEPKSIRLKTSWFKKIGIIGSVLLLIVAAAVIKTSQVVYQAHQEQQELIAYRADKAEKEEKLQLLLKENEKIEKEMAEISILEAEVRQALNQSGAQASRSGVERSQYLGQGGPSPAKVESMEIYSAQNKNLQEQMQYKKDSLGNLLGQMQEFNKRKASLPDLWPTDGGVITSSYGGRADPFGNRSYDWHPGIDIANDYGVPVYASGAGSIEHAGWYSGYGRYVKIIHGYGYETAYGHMSSLAVEPGQTVKKGDIIGYVGSSGYSTGPHIHFEVFYNGQETDPMELIR